jgi:hypothetical protein
MPGKHFAWMVGENLNAANIIVHAGKSHPMKTRLKKYPIEAVCDQCICLSPGVNIVRIYKAPTHQSSMKNTNEIFIKISERDLAAIMRYKPTVNKSQNANEICP